MDVKQHERKKKTHPSVINLMVSVDVKHHVYLLTEKDPESRSCVKVEVAVMGFPS